MILLGRENGLELRSRNISLEPFDYQQGPLANGFCPNSANGHVDDRTTLCRRETSKVRKLQSHNPIGR